MPSAGIGRFWPARGIPVIMSALTRSCLGLVVDGVLAMDKSCLFTIQSPSPALTQGDGAYDAYGY